MRYFFAVASHCKKTVAQQKKNEAGVALEQQRNSIKAKAKHRGPGENSLATGRREGGRYSIPISKVFENWMGRIRGRAWKRIDLLLHSCHMSCTSLLPQTQPEHQKHSPCHMRYAHSTHLSISHSEQKKTTSQRRKTLHCEKITFGIIYFYILFCVQTHCAKIRGIFLQWRFTVKKSVSPRNKRSPIRSHLGPLAPKARIMPLDQAAN